MNLERELEIHLRSRCTLIYIISREEERLIRLLRDLCQATQRAFFVWDHADFFHHVDGAPSPKEARDPLSALEAIDQSPHEGVFALKDFHQCWEKQPRVVRKLRNICQRLKYTKKTVVVLSPVLQVPEELRDDCVIIDVPLPEMEDLERILDRLLENPHVKVEIDEAGRERLVRAALGLSSNQAQRVFARALVSNGVLEERDITQINESKRQIIGESGALEYFSPSETLSDVGGLEVLKEWLRVREKAFSKEAKVYGLPPPRGVALIGIPGSGKSLSAKMTASLWQLPLIRLDVGALYGSLVGQSEENVRRALMLVETVSPCVLWIDEIEKSLSVGLGDGGTSMRVLATLLSWMQEKRKPVFIVATANNLALLPPELLRRGRFDEVFFLDLPTRKERRAIFEVHISKRNRPPQRFDLDALAAASEGYVGAEIEQAVIDAMYRAFDDSQRPGREFTTQDILASLERIVPLSRSQREIVEDLRTWLTEGRAQSASFREIQEAREQFVPIQLDPMGPPGLREAH